ncbi:urea amidolyase family protein [Pseudomonas sp. ICMP22404]|uniref:5-oxoprolinase subunit B/C family protein n=1 Tax=Pseudomonas sp. ICMP22404 TaxID=2583807 RepID=UPI00211E3D54|nr:urea amidolyase family protein [Pseudomonas sp. ICMP22404]
MNDSLLFRRAGSNGLLIELPDLDATVALFEAIAGAAFAGVEEVIPGARTLLIQFNALVVSHDELVRLIGGLESGRRAQSAGQLIEIPVVYDGEDLAFVAAHLGWSVEQLISRHRAATFTVAFTGFAPGFAYMTCDDPQLNVPRRESPRVRIPAGSVAIAGSFCGVYPTDSPGGWQLLGSTPSTMWDLTRERAALLAPGDRVRFREISQSGSVPAKASVQSSPVQQVSGSAGLRVISTDRPALFQDAGRHGCSNQGVSGSGAADQAALRAANELLGNPLDWAAVEITYGGFALEAGEPVTCAVTGAGVPVRIESAQGHIIEVPTGVAFALDAGDILKMGVPMSGVRSYLAIRGGLEVEKVLGSASTDTLAKLGPAPLKAGDVLLPAHKACASVHPFSLAGPPLPRGSDLITLDVVMGPRTDWFTAQSVLAFFSQSWTATSESSRVGVRLQGAQALVRARQDELPSEGTCVGSIQVPASGQPVLFLADHPLTGGYPVIAVVASHHLDLAAQVPIGCKIRFNPIVDFSVNGKEKE